MRVKIYPTYLVIQKPGRLPENWTAADLRRKHASRPNNPDIARVFYLRALMEQLGMGTQKIIQECTAIGAKAPKWKVEQGSVWLTLFRTPEPDVRIELSDRQRQFLEATHLGEEYKPSDFTQITGISERQVRRDLGELQQFGLLEKKGRGPSTVYIRTEKEYPK